MKRLLSIVGFMTCVITPWGFSIEAPPSKSNDDAKNQTDVEKGPRGGRLLIDGSFVLELSIFETGVPPEFRVWLANDGVPIAPSDVSLNIELTRLGGVKDIINFSVQGDFLRGDMVIYEPHSFVVSVKAEYQNKTHAWKYDNFEGRTQIEIDVAKAMKIGTSIAGPAVLKETVNVYGKLVEHVENKREISARFEGMIKNVYVSLGQRVKVGQSLVTVESNESLKPYSIVSPIDGIIGMRSGNPGEQTSGRILLTIVNSSILLADLAVFPADRQRVKRGSKVQVLVKGEEMTRGGVISYIDGIIQPNQSIIARVQLKNDDGSLVPGSFVIGEIEVKEHNVPLAVKRSGLQAFRDFTVVFAKIGNEYEVRMLELGFADGEWVEVLGGLEPGTEYVSENSYIIKADIEKSGASHDH